MTNEKMYAEIVAMLKCYERETGRNLGDLEKLLANTAELERLAAFTACPNIYASAARIILPLLDSMDKKTSGAGRVNAIKRIVKTAQDYNAAIKGIFQDAGYFVACSGYHAVRLTSDITSIKHTDPYSFSVAKIFADIPNKTSADVLRRPKASEIKAFCAENGLRRNTCKTPYTPPEWPEWIAVNPYYLLDMLEALPEAEIVLPYKLHSMIYFRGGNGEDGILCPIRVKDGAEKFAAWQDERNNQERRSA